MLLVKKIVDNPHFKYMTISPFWWWFPQFSADFFLLFSVFCVPFQGNCALVHGESQHLWKAQWGPLSCYNQLHEELSGRVLVCSLLQKVTSENVLLYLTIIHKKKVFMSNQRQTYFALISLAYIASFQVWHKVWAHIQYPL